MTLKAIRFAALLGALCSTPSLARTDAALKAALANWDQDAHPDLRGVVVLRDGHIVAERYYTGSLND